MYPTAFLKRLVNKFPVSKPGNIGSKREKNAPQKEKILRRTIYRCRKTTEKSEDKIEDRGDQCR